MKRISLLALLALAATAARADEGMWTYDNFPKDKLAKKYGFQVTDQWLESARLSSVRLAGGCSGSFVSGDGLVMTNHHCVRTCVQQLSTKERNFMAQGFFAPAQENETRCPEIELNQLLGIGDVTARVSQAAKGLKAGSPEANKAQKAEKTKIEAECSKGDAKLRCEVIDLYHGGVFALYKFKRFQDVRLVMAPEFEAAHFGGDPDNFEFPRYSLDMGFLRAYEDGKPASTPQHFKWSENGAKDGELTFVSGNPGSTQRQLTVKQYEFVRDVEVPLALIGYAEWRGILTRFSEESPERARIAQTDLLGIENSYKALRGRYDAVSDPKFMAQKVAEEQKLRSRVKGKPELQKSAGDAWDRLAKALDTFRPRRREYSLIEGLSPRTGPAAFQGSRLFQHARTLVRGTVDREKPEGERLREFRESAMPQLKQSLFSKAPIYDELEVLKIAYGLGKAREYLGPDHPFVKKLLGKKSPQELAEELVAKTTLKSPETRQQLWEGGAKAVQASQDPILQLVAAIDPESRQLRKWHDDTIEAPENAASEAIARARFALEGTGSYPDATFTLRLSYGSVEGWTRKDGRKIEPFTYWSGLFERATGRFPFELPQAMAAAKDRVDPKVPYDFATSNDIIGGNSGSPVINKDQQIVGLIFDGNFPSLGGDYFFDPSDNRAVAVHSSAILQALEKVYGAQRVADELRGKPKTAAK